MYRRAVDLMRESRTSFSHFFFFNDTATTEIYTLSLHDALPISRRDNDRSDRRHVPRARDRSARCRHRRRDSGATPVSDSGLFGPFCPFRETQRHTQELRVKMQKLQKFRRNGAWWPQRDSNPCLSGVTFRQCMQIVTRGGRAKKPTQRKHELRNRIFCVTWTAWRSFGCSGSFAAAASRHVIESLL